MKSGEDWVLVVDDDLDLCLILSRILAKTCRVEVVHSLEEARCILLTKTPSSIFLDNNLPDGLGVNFVSRIRDTEKSVYIVVMTAGSLAHTRTEAMENGADLFIEKPFSAGQVRDILHLAERKAAG